jgi:hypothetical protein
MSVIQLSSRRPAPTGENLGYLVCECGSAWFELCTIDSDGTKHHGAVSLNDAGSVTGYSGTPHCLECGREKLP